MGCKEKEVLSTIFNKQLKSPEKITTAKLPVMEIFYSLQGEGIYAGSAACFVRLGGCDVGCHWCDVKESWAAEKHAFLSPQDVLARLPSHARMIVITGGEPLMWDLEFLTHLLKDKGYRLHIETSGAYPLSGVFDWICLSPKKKKLPLPHIYSKAHELKMVIHNRHDFIFAEDQAARVGDDCFLLLQPEWGRSQKMLPQIIEYIKRHPRWRMSLQTHKFMDIN